MNGCVIRERVLGLSSYCILGQIYLVYFAAVLPQTYENWPGMDVCATMWLNNGEIFVTLSMFSFHFLNWITGTFVHCSYNFKTLLGSLNHRIIELKLQICCQNHIFLSLVVTESRSMKVDSCFITFPVRFIADTIVLFQVHFGCNCLITAVTF